MTANPLRHTKRLRLAMLAATLFLLLGHYLLPAKIRQLHPAAGVEQIIYGFIDPEQGESNQWVNERESEWVCDYLPTYDYGCGFALVWDRHEVNGIDLSEYDAIRLTLRYQGSADNLRVFMRNYNPHYSMPDDSATTKFMSALFAFREMNANQISVPLNRFAVADWWLREHMERHRWSAVELNNITQIGINFIEPGHHQLRVEKVELVGRWLSTAQMLTWVLVAWMLLFIAEGCLLLWQLYWVAAYNRKRQRALQRRQRSLAIEKASLQKLAHKDPLTGILNRRGAEEHIKRLYQNTYSKAFTAVLLLNLDNFKLINEQFGHDKGDAILKAFSALIQMNLESSDIFARWGSEEFLLVCVAENQQDALYRAEKLRQLTERTHLSPAPGFNVTTSIGVAAIGGSESFQQALTRAGAALQHAKRSGRNRVKYEMA
ncbi:GGDEF domain-containing protein [Teredinibacter turnerae]|uniref:GGDEF domain-containing protein n=1 Tax=Teredinibacter turnerae TaxID=2426 RepID=UPI00049039BF|nr:GGDEF domain-containing protein [Teredinibacter turnerae]